MASETGYTLQLVRDGDSVGYVGGQDDKEPLTIVERHARRFHDAKAIDDYRDMAHHGRTRVKVLATDELKAEPATPFEW